MRESLIVLLVAIVTVVWLCERAAAHTCIHDEIAAHTTHHNTPKVLKYDEARTSLMAERTASSTGECTIDAEGEGPTENMRIHVVYSTMLSDDEERSCFRLGDKVVYGTSGTDDCVGSADTNCLVPCTGSLVVTGALGEYISTKLMPAAVARIEAMLRVVPVTEPLTFDSTTTCGARGNVPLPEELITGWSEGVEADFVVLVTARPTLGNTIAYASSCVYDQQGRPLLAHINFGPSQITIASEVDERTLAVAVHELTHALGFSSSLFSTYLGASQVVVPMRIGTEAIGYDVSGIATPCVREYASTHFGCSAGVAAMPLEDGGGAGTAGSHWEKRVAYDEYMTGTVEPAPVISPITLALFADMGWYMPVMSAASTWGWGRSKGCAFVEDRCTSQNTGVEEGYSCIRSAAGRYACDYKGTGRGLCDLRTFTSLSPEYRYFEDDLTLAGGDPLMDYCPLPVLDGFGSCRVAAHADPNVAPIVGARYTAVSSCFQSSLASTLFETEPLREGTCYPQGCAENGQWWLQVGVTWAPCKETMSIVNYEGVLECPESNSPCEGLSGDFPTVSSVSPEEASYLGGDAFTITGTNFDDTVVYVTVAGLVCGGVEIESSTQIRCVSESYAYGTATNGDYDVVVVKSSGLMGRGGQVSLLGNISGGPHLRPQGGVAVVVVALLIFVLGG